MKTSEFKESSNFSEQSEASDKVFPPGHTEVVTSIDLADGEAKLAFFQYEGSDEETQALLKRVANQLKEF